MYHENTTKLITQLWKLTEMLTEGRFMSNEYFCAS